MKKITFDTNCIIEIEENQPAAPFLKDIVALNNRGLVSLQVCAISASERQRGGKKLTSFSEFEKRIGNIGIDKAEILLPIFYWDVCFWGKCVYPNDQMVELEKNIHSILFPNVEYEYQKYIKVNKEEKKDKWLNAKCDVLALWCHINYNGDIFVTIDENFHKESKKYALEELGAGKILKPEEALKNIT